MRLYSYKILITNKDFENFRSNSIDCASLLRLNLQLQSNPLTTLQANQSKNSIVNKIKSNKLDEKKCLIS